MNENSLQNKDNQPGQIEVEATMADLPVTPAQQDQVKGGPIYMDYEGVKGTVSTVSYQKGIQ